MIPGTRLIELLFPQFDLMRKFEDIVDLNISTNNSVMGGAIGAGRSHDVVGSMAHLTDRYGRSQRLATMPSKRAGSRSQSPRLRKGE